MSAAHPTLRVGGHRPGARTHSGPEQARVLAIAVASVTRYRSRASPPQRLRREVGRVPTMARLVVDEARVWGSDTPIADITDGGCVVSNSNERIVLLPGEGRSIDLGGFAMCVKASGSQTGGLFTMLESDEPPGFGPPLHIHYDTAEAFYVIKGEYRIFIGDEEFVCPAGSFIYIPVGVTHGFRVGDVPSRKLNLYAPAAMVGYFDDLSKTLQAGEAHPDVLADIARTHAMEVVGPVPEGYL